MALSQNTLQELANSMGIQQRVATMSEAEKAQLRYIQIIKSTTEWQGDMARTLISPANAIRVLKQQFILFGRALGRVVIPFVMKTIPYVMALTQVLTDLANKIASFFGYKITDIDYSSLKDISLGIEDMGDAAEETTNKLNTMLAPFDELNVVQNEKNNGTSPLTSLFGNEYDLPEYDALAGLTKEMEKNVEGAKKNLKQMIPVVSTILGILGTLKTIKTFEKISDWLKNTGNSAKKIASIFGFKSKKSVSGGLGETLENTGKLADVSKKVESKLKLPKWSTIIKGLGQLALVVTAVVGYVTVLGLFMQIPGVKNTIIDGAWALEETFTSIARILIPLAGISVGVLALGSINMSQIVLGLANLGIVILGTETVILAIGTIQQLLGGWLESGIDSIKKVFNGISDIALPLIGVSAALALTGLSGSAGVAAFATGLANFGIVIGGTAALLTAIGGLLSIPGFKDLLGTGIESVKSVFNGLYDIAVPLGVFTAYILVLGFATPAPIVSGLAGFATIVGGLSVLLAALGALNQIPGFDWILGEGGKVLTTIGDILGGFAGSIVSGFLGKATDSLPKIGTDLTKFMKNAEPFFEKSTKIKKESMQGIEYLVKALLELTGQNILDSITKWFTGGTSLTKFGKDLAEFAPYFNKYAHEIEDINVDIVNGTSNTVKAIIEFSRNVPNEGGMISWFTGDNKLGKFAQYLPELGTNMKNYYNNIKGIDASIVSDSANSAKSIAEFANNLPNQGGVASWFSGDNKLSTFGNQLAKFGVAFKEYYDSIKGITVTTINNVSDSVAKLVSSLKIIKENNLNNTLKDFGKSLSKGSEGLSDFFGTTFSQTNATSLGTRFGETVGSNIKSGVTKKLNNMKISLNSSGGTSLSTFTIKAYAKGGFPKSGDFFLANEAGPELVGKIGNQTAVANNDQITTSITNALVTALSGMNLGGGQNKTIVNIGGRKVYEGVGTYVDSENDRYGTNYIQV